MNLGHPPALNHQIKLKFQLRRALVMKRWRENRQITMVTDEKIVFHLIAAILPSVKNGPSKRTELRWRVCEFQSWCLLRSSSTEDPLPQGWRVCSHFAQLWLASQGPNQKPKQKDLCLMAHFIEKHLKHRLGPFYNQIFVLLFVIFLLFLVVLM